MNEYDFSQQLVMSNGVATNSDVTNILLSSIPGAISIQRATLDDDRSGVDWWVERKCGRPLGVDAKVREKDWTAKGEDDLALETWSVVERRVQGWTRNHDKKTDYILWLWQDTGRWCLVPFTLLCAVFQTNWERWASQYKCCQQYTRDRDYHSECVFVPRRVVWSSIYQTFSGTPKDAGESP